MATLDRVRWDQSLADLNQLMNVALGQRDLRSTQLATAKANYELATERVAEVSAALQTFNQAYLSIWPVGT